MSDYKTPGVYIQEESSSSGAIYAVETAIPAFIGYTEKGARLKMVSIASMDDYINEFGGAPEVKCDLTPAIKSSKYYLYQSMKMFYANGGGNCFVVSVGDYSSAPNSSSFDNVFDLLEKYQEPTMIVIPDAVALDADKCYALQQQMINHCQKMQTCVAILDIWNGFEDNNNNIINFRKNLNQHLQYGAAYHPWLNTTALSLTDVGYKNIETTELQKLQENLCTQSPAKGITVNGTKVTIAEERSLNIFFLIGAINPNWIRETIKEVTVNGKIDDKYLEKFNKVMDRDYANPENNNNTLCSIFPSYKELMTSIQTQINILPPSGIMAGIYTIVDQSYNVGRTPANYAVSSVINPAFIITSREQEDLNTPIDGKAVNAIRQFRGRGTLVWGARTLDGNSREWRYINVRRSVIMIESSIRIGLDAYIFSPNIPATWKTLKAEITAFLTNQWDRGILIGRTPEEAFQVDVDLGTTMTAQDILDGIMRVSVKLAVTRPLEFIEVTFQQIMPQA